MDDNGKGEDGELENEDGFEEGLTNFVKACDMPCKDAVEAHYASGHVPFRAWCKCCIWGMAQDRMHQKQIRNRMYQQLGLIGCG